MSTTLQEETETESREMNVWICFECECWTEELDSELANVQCGNCGNKDVRIEKSCLIDVEVEVK